MNYFSENEKSSSSSSFNTERKNLIEKINYYLELIKDKTIIYKFHRWIFVLILLLIYLIRVIKTKGYYALTYCIGIHFLNSFIGFISPLEDPEDNLNEDNSFLPQKNNEEFKPFHRKVKEYQFWNVLFLTLFISIFLTFFDCFDIPVFWPLLLVYFILIFLLTMKNQIKHMIKYNYLPWDSGKKNYSHTMPNQK